MLLYVFCQTIYQTIKQLINFQQTISRIAQFLLLPAIVSFLSATNQVGSFKFGSFSSVRIQLMQSSSEIALTFTQQILCCNPESDQARCRICYQDSRPLITLCECSGSIGFMHESCIIDWITRKLQVSEAVQMPKCQICRCAYSAKLKVGNKKICYKTFISKVKKLQVEEIALTVFFLMGTILAFYINSLMVFQVISSLWNYTLWQDEVLSKVSFRSLSAVFTQLFTTVVFPLFYLQAALQNGKKRARIWHESLVQVVELTLAPKISIKQ